MAFEAASLPRGFLTVQGHMWGTLTVYYLLIYFSFLLFVYIFFCGIVEQDLFFLISVVIFGPKANHIIVSLVFYLFVIYSSISYGYSRVKFQSLCDPFPRFGPWSRMNVYTIWCTAWFGFFLFSVGFTEWSYWNNLFSWIFRRYTVLDGALQAQAPTTPVSLTVFSLGTLCLLFLLHFFTNFALLFIPCLSYACMHYPRCLSSYWVKFDFIIDILTLHCLKCLCTNKI